MSDDDEEIKDRIESEVFWSTFVDGGDLSISVDDGAATLTGTLAAGRPPGRR